MCIRDRPYVVVLALVVSVLESFLILPSHMSMGEQKALPQKREFIGRLEEWYRRTLERVLHHRIRVVGGFLVAFFIVMFVCLPQLRVIIFPQDDAEAVFVKVTTPLGTPIEQTEAVIASIERQIPQIIQGDLAAVTARVGHQDAGGKGFDRDQGSAENEGVVSALMRRGDLERSPLQWLSLIHI